MRSAGSLEVQVRSLTWEAEGVLSLELRPADGGLLPEFEAGAHLDLHLPTEEGTLVRSYSICNAPGERTRYWLGVGRDRASRGGSRWVHEQLRPGQRLRADGPRNHFRLNESAPAFALVAGGIGVTPILAIARRLVALRKPVRMLYAVRSRAAGAFLGELQALAIDIHLHVDDEQGRPPDVAAWLRTLSRDTGCYGCGPAPMLDAFVAGCALAGIADAHIERFAAGTPSDPPPGGAFVVECRRSGRQVSVAAGVSILQALLDAGLDVPYSCREGMCGTCETRVLEGDVEHRDGVLGPAERTGGAVMMLCVSRAKGPRLVLDL